MPPLFENIVLRFLTWLGKHEFHILLAVVGIAGSVWMFALLADEVMEGGTQAFDRKLLLMMRHPGDLAPIGPPAVSEAARDVTALGGFTVLSLLTVITGGFLFLEGKRRMALFTLGSVAGGLLVTMILKDAFHRQRPDIVPHADYVSTTSFPSGHSMMSAVTYLTLGALLARSQKGKHLKAYVLLVAILLTFLVGLSRVYLGVHWPTDVLAGWGAGAAWALLCSLAASLLQTHGSLEPESEHESRPIQGQA